MTESINTIAVNLLGGPGIGKSTLAAEVFVLLKKRQIQCEYITEYAKDKTWEESMMTLQNQIYVFAKQQHKMYRVGNKVDVMICDSSLLFSIIYGNVDKDTPLYDLILEEFNRFNNITFMLKRETIFDGVGRNQNVSEAIEIDSRIESLLIDNNIDYMNYHQNQGAESIVEKIIEKL